MLFPHAKHNNELLLKTFAIVKTRSIVQQSDMCALVESCPFCPVTIERKCGRPTAELVGFVCGGVLCKACPPVALRYAIS